MSNRPGSGSSRPSASGPRRAEDRTASFLLDNLPPMSFELPPIRVPWMGGEYRKTAPNFFNLPAQWGFDLTELENGSFGDHGDQQGLAFLQHWLFFGMLQEALGEQHRIDPRDWIDAYDSTNPRQKYMISPKLSYYLIRIQDRLRDPRQRQPTWEHWTRVFGRTSQVVEAFDHAFARRSGAADVEQHDPLKITWSILMLGQIVTNVIMECYGVDDSNFKHWPDGTILHLRIGRQMQCPHRCNKMMALFAMDAIYVLSLLAFRNSGSPYAALPEEADELSLAPLSLYDEDLTRGRGRHRNCSVKRCLGEKIDERSYQTAHTSDRCICDSVGPKVKEVIQILDNSEVPAFVVTEVVSHGKRSVSVNVVKAKSSKYVAISHVWADGLGNKDDNRLPICQALRLARLVDDLTGRKEQPFWIDTFGIPRNLEERKKALRVMDSTYSLAEKVLVLDGGLQNHLKYQAMENELRGLNTAIAEQKRDGVALELLLRIVCCSWTSRLWTLPEGMLGSELYFQFSDGTVELGDLVAQLRMRPRVGSNIVSDLISVLIRLRPKLRTQSRRGLAPFDPMMLVYPQGNAYGQFVSMFQALEFRDTSWKEDEATCLGIHLGLDLRAILARREPERLEALFAQLRQIPADLIFTHGERIPRYPYRWAPLHLLEYKDNYLCIPAATPNTTIGTRTDRGLRAVFDYFTLHTRNERVPATTQIFFSIQVRSDDGVECPVSYGMSPASQDPRDAVNWRQTKTHHALVAGGKTAERLYLLLGGSGVPGPLGMASNGHVGLLVQKNGEEDGWVYCAPLDTVVVYEMPGSRRVVRQNNEQFVHWHAEETVDGHFCIG